MADGEEVVLVQVNATDGSSLRHVRELIFEYTQFLMEQGCDVGSFQDLEVELKELPGRYSREHGGALLVCYPSSSLYAQGSDAVHRASIMCKEGSLKDADAMACIALKALNEEGDCEIKRLYVRERYRNMGLAKVMTRCIIQQAKKADSYQTIKLDTLDRLPFCVQMYTSMGFKACPPYVPNPEGDAVYLSLTLPVRPRTGRPEVEEAAEKFISARRVPNTAIANDLPVVPSIPDAYLIHSAIARAGQVIVGWKVGASNEGAQQRLGLTAPFRAPLFSPNVRRGPCPVAWEELGAKLSALEAEFAFTIKTAIAPRPSKAYTEEDVWACVGSMSVAIEIAATRSPQATPASPETIATLIADYGLHGVLVLGHKIPADAVDWKSLPEASATVSRVGGGKGMSSEGKGSNVLGNPVSSLAWLVNSLSSDGVTLEEGAIVTTGAAAIIGADKCPWGEKCMIKAELGGLPAQCGDASVTLDLPDA